jgi:hypothetical protein
MRRGTWKREHELPSFPFHCYTNPSYADYTFQGEEVAYRRDDATSSWARLISARTSPRW